jgi:O-antigen/teichoic acid export membrane protein
LSNRIERLKKSQYFNAINRLAFGSLIAQIITILVSPISTRLYTPEELGVYTLVLTIISLFGPVLCARYDLVIVSAKDDAEVTNLMAGSGIISIIFTIFITIGVSFYLDTTPAVKEEIGGFIYIVIPILLLTGLTNILTSYNNRKGEYKTISSVYVIRTFIQNIGLVIFGVLKLGSIGLLISKLIGTLSGIKKQGENLDLRLFKLDRMNLSNVIHVLKKYKNQPTFSMPAQLLNSASYNLINFFISTLFGIGVFGFYSMTYRILGLPLTLISVNVSKVYFQRASSDFGKYGNYNKTLINNSLFLLAIAIPMVAFLMIFGPNLFAVVFGEEWIVAGQYVRILAPMYGMRLIVSALSPSLIVSGKQKLEFFMQSLFLFISVSSYIICDRLGLGMEVFLTLISIGYSLIYGVFYITMFRLSKNK